MPNLSVSIPNREPQKVSSSGIVICPPSDRLLNRWLISSVLWQLIDKLTELPLVTGWLGIVSDAIKVKLLVDKMACMILFFASSGTSSIGELAKSINSKSPPKMSL